MHFDASSLVQQGRVCPGQRYSVYLNPFSLDRLIVCDAALRYLGTARLWDRVQRLNQAEAVKRLAHARRQEAPSLQNLARRGAAQTRHMADLRENNAAVVTGHAAPARPRRRHEAVEVLIFQAAEDAALLDSEAPLAASALPAPSRQPSRPIAQRLATNDLDLL